MSKFINLSLIFCFSFAIGCKNNDKNQCISINVTGLFYNGDTINVVDKDNNTIFASVYYSPKGWGILDTNLFSIICKDKYSNFYFKVNNNDTIINIDFVSDTMWYLGLHGQKPNRKFVLKPNYRGPYD